MFSIRYTSFPPTQLFIGKNLLTPKILEGNIVIVVDSALKDLYGKPLAKMWDAALISIPSGEKGKKKKTQEYLENTLFKMGVERDVTLVALGGGATLDLVGFVASIYLRGVALVLIPTTVLAVVDAAIGGKTGINTPFGKNLIGTFYPPKSIFADLNMLDTLPEKEKLNGLAEILKIGLVFDASIIEEEGEKQILKAIKGKIAIIEQDPRELGLRRVLNFGHTIGHGLEKIANYKMAHGEAVALGSLAACHLSFSLGFLSKTDFERIQKIFTPFSLKLPKNYSKKKLIKAMAHDKKKSEGKLRFVLIDQIGHAIAFDGAYCRPVSETELKPTLDWIEKCYG